MSAVVFQEFTIPVLRIDSETQDFYVSAPSYEAAKELAQQQAYNYAWGRGEAEYEVGDGIGAQEEANAAILDALHCLVAELEYWEFPQADAEGEFGPTTAWGMAKARLHAAGKDWTNKDVARCDELVAEAKQLDLW